MKSLIVQNQEGQYEFRKPLTSKELIVSALDVLSKQVIKGEEICSTEASQSFLRLSLGGEEREVFAALFLDNRHRVIAFEKLFFGTISSAAVHPREIIKRALELNAAALILAHNHPSGVVTPSQSDIDITQAVKQLTDLIEVRVLDHIIVSSEGSYSMAKQGDI